jgi:hypothetical protein
MEVFICFSPAMKLHYRAKLFKNNVNNNLKKINNKEKKHKNKK